MDKIENKFSGVVAESGDTLVISVDQILNSEQRKQYTEMVEKALKTHGVHVLVLECATVQAVIKP